MKLTYYLTRKKPLH